MSHFYENAEDIRKRQEKMMREILKDMPEKKGGLRKIRDLDPRDRPCLHPEHEPPTMIVLKPGVYEYVCPGCKRSTSFTVPYPPTCKVDRREREGYGPPRVPDMRPSVKSYNPDDLKFRASKEEWKTRYIVSQPSAEDLKPTKEDIQRYDELYKWEQAPLPNTMFD